MYSFINLQFFLQEPSYLFRVWEGGMSFHGGLIGVILSMLITAKLRNVVFGQQPICGSSYSIWLGHQADW